MQNIRSAVYAIAGLAFVGLAAAFAVSLTLVIGALLTVTLGARMLMGKTKRAPAYVKAKRRDDVRVWNDGKGTIIDLWSGRRPIHHLTCPPGEMSLSRGKRR